MSRLHRPKWRRFSPKMEIISLYRDSTRLGGAQCGRTRSRLIGCPRSRSAMYTLLHYHGTKYLQAFSSSASTGVLRPHPLIQEMSYDLSVIKKLKRTLPQMCVDGHIDDYWHNVPGMIWCVYGVYERGYINRLHMVPVFTGGHACRGRPDVKYAWKLAPVCSTYAASAPRRLPEKISQVQ